MSDLRKDPLTGDWAIIAERRGERPIEYQQNFQRNGQPICPFCRGNENETPPTIQDYRLRSKDPWTVRVVPNKFPAIEKSETENELPDVSDKICGNGACQSHQDLLFELPAMGVNEIIIESARHVVSFSELNDDELRLTMQAFQDAVLRCENRAEAKTVALFKNCRFPAGASIEHTHSQVISLPVVPSQLERQVDNCRRYYQKSGKPLLTAIVDQELQQACRLVAEEHGLAAFCPYASRTPYQTWITSIHNDCQFTELDQNQLFSIAALVRKTVLALESVLSDPAYNLIIHLAPLRLKDDQRIFQWFVEIFPRLTRAAGLELGTGCWINPVPPELAADQLRTHSRQVVKAN
jgi:UDPglucose--hexose-1-phosphate uridylyltransferase